jgi:hypothetical protein
MVIDVKEFEGEELIDDKKSFGAVLTTHRIHYYTGSRLNGEYMVMNLEDISSINLKYSSISYYLYLSILALFSTLIFYERIDNLWVILMLLVGVVFLFLFFSSRKRVVAIESKGGALMLINVNKRTIRNISDFINLLSHARNSRIKKLS